MASPASASATDQPDRSPAVSAWKRLSAAQRRRIVLVGLVGLALAARDLVLLSFAGGLLALSEMTASPSRSPSPS